MERKERLFVGFCLLGILVFLGWDITDDLAHGSTWQHVAEELVIGAFAALGLGLLWARFFRIRRENVRMRGEVARVSADLDAYKQETSHLVQGINEKVQSQLTKWGLSPAEKDVCLLLLKGMATKDIASARQASEKTVTQQLSAVYQKSGLHGRAELLAFFLEDIFQSG